MKLSVVVPTKNEEANIAACLESFAPFWAEVETIVVDNGSTDRTREIAARLGARVYEQGPERSAQRNRGWREATQPYVLFADADMIFPRELVAEILARIETASHDAVPKLALYVREVRVGKGLRMRARNFERSFYDATAIDGLRVMPRSLLEVIGGFDESLVACEDWDLDRRLLAAGAQTALTENALLHNEARQDLKRFLRKKAYYAQSVARYRAKWGDDARCRQQFGLAYRYAGVFFERGKWRKVLCHPVLYGIMMCERFAVGVTYLLNRGKELSA